MSDVENSVGNTGRNGGRLRRGNPGNRGGGRKTLEFKAECARLADEEVLPKLAQKIADSGPDDAAWRWAAEKVLDYSKQKIAQGVNLASADGETVIRVIRKTATPTPVDADDD
jgi:hypothetical protein